MENFNGKTITWPALPTLQTTLPQAWQRQGIHGATQEVAQRATQEVAQGTTQEVAQGATQEVVQGANQEVAQGATQEVVEEATQEVVEEATQEAGQSAAQRGNFLPSQGGGPYEGQQNAGASLSRTQNPPHYPTLRDVGLRGEGYVQSQIDLPSNMRILKLLQIVPTTSTRNGFNATTIAIQRQTSRGTFTFYLPYSQKMYMLNALSVI